MSSVSGAATKVNLSVARYFYFTSIVSHDTDSVKLGLPSKGPAAVEDIFSSVDLSTKYRGALSPFLRVSAVAPSEAGSRYC